MSSHPPSTCCIIGVKHEGEAEGTMGKVGQCTFLIQYNAYFAHPKDKNTGYGIVLIPDFMGYEFINTKLMADQFAANGYLTVIPDIWEGDNVPLNWTPTSDFNLMQWMKHHGPEKVEPVIEAARNVLLKEHGVKAIGGTGYCLGAKYLCRFMAKGRGIDVGFIAHPSATSDDEVRGVAGPISIAAAEIDALFPASKRQKTEEIFGETKVPYQLSVYNNVEHGFALKADLSIGANKIACETAFYQAVNWFNMYLGRA